MAEEATLWSGAELGARWDEMHDADGDVRDPWGGVADALTAMGTEGLHERRGSVRRMLADDGVTYRSQGSEVEQPWTLDPVPLLVDAAEWATLEAGVVQRSELLDLILTDLYGPRTLLERGLIPPEIILGHEGFLREVDQIRLPGPRQLFLTAADLARDPRGQWTVLSDRTQAPSGAGYAMQNRQVVARVFAELYRETRIQRISPFFHTMSASLQHLSPTAEEMPRVVLLTPGARSETAFDQAFLAAMLGFPLVEGSDLTVREGRLWQRSLGGLEPVDVVLRRLDSWFCDPLELRPDSRLGVPGLVEAARLGSVSIVNGLGTGVLENPALAALLPRLARELLGEPLRLPTMATWWCGDTTHRQHVLARMDELVIKPISRRVGSSSKFGWLLTADERDELSRRIQAEPWAWVGQEAVTLGTAPTVADRGLERRPAVLRAFAVAAEGSYRVMNGGLTRVAPDAESPLVSNQVGAVAKDVWVVSRERRVGEAVLPDQLVPAAITTAISPRVAEDLFWLGRYAERAEDVARLLRVADGRYRDVHPRANPALARCLVVLLGALTEVTTTWPGFSAAERLAAPEAELRVLVGDDQRDGTLAHDVRRMRELASAVRDQLSQDTWIVLSGLDRGLAPFARPGVGVAELPGTLAQVMEALLAFSGLAAESMVRDSGWRFMDAGRRIERALQITGLVGACLTTVSAPAVEEMVCESVLTAGESIITHRRRYAGRIAVGSVLELLLFDNGNPRSLAHQLDRLRADLAHVPSVEVDSPVWATLGEVTDLLAREDPARLAVSRDEQRPGLIELTGAIEQGLRALAEAVTKAHFVQPAPLQQLGVLDVA